MHGEHHVVITGQRGQSDTGTAYGRRRAAAGVSRASETIYALHDALLRLPHPLPGNIDIRLADGHLSGLEAELWRSPIGRAVTARYTRIAGLFHYGQWLIVDPLTYL
jgi:hypothetical protein